MKRADGPQSGTLTAIDVNSGKIGWQYKSAQPMFGGVLATASDLIFAGEMNGDFSAFDAVSGAKLWSHRFDHGVCSPPITYRVKGCNIWQWAPTAAGRACIAWRPCVHRRGRDLCAGP